MLNDEQILLKTAQLLENLSVSNKKPQELHEKVLREIEEGEFEAIQDVLDDLKGEDLAFNGLFNGEMRKVIDFPTMDPSTELGQFGNFFKKQDFDVDWEKGLVSAEREVSKHNLDDLVNQLMGGEPMPSKKKKIQMKIGKYFAKVADLSSKRDILYQKVYDHMDKMNYTGAHGKIDVPWKVSGKMLNAALDEKELESYGRISDQIGLYIPNPGVAGAANYALTDLATKYGEYWKKNAGYIKKEINKLDNDKYSIIITRHPIDVMRMSDFEDITSCHSPPSHKAYQGVEYYKCAVAEARGHGAVAYVVETEDILHTTNTSNIESAEQEIQDGEIFYDDKRSYAGEGGELNPVSRTRLRQFRYYDTDTPKRWDEGTELAVPEKRVYGVDIPGFVDRVVKWADENQKKAIRNMPETDEMVNLNRFWIFGGSYEDHKGPEGRKELLSALTDIDEMHFTGEVHQNKETEDVIDLSLLGDNAARFERECNEIKDEWNNKYADVVVDFELEETDTNQFSIVGNAWLQIDWDYDEWVKLPNPYPTGMHAADYINEQWGDIFVSKDAFINKRSDGTIRWGCKLNGANPMVAKESSSHATSHGTYFGDPYEFRTFCEEIDVSIDDKRDGFRAGLEEFFKQEEWMDGGAYIKLAREIENAEISSYEWDVRYDGEHPTESYEATAAVSYNFNPEALGLNSKVLFDILDSTGWRLAVRTALLESARQAIGTEYYLDIENSQADEHINPGQVRYTITFRITSDDPDERVNLFRELVTGEDSDMDDEDNLKAAFDSVMAQFLNSRQPSHMQQSLDERLVKTWKGFIGR